MSTKQNASTAITTSNIGSQSVNYATSAGNSTKWNGKTDDSGTLNTTDTWIPVYASGKMQHTLREIWNSKQHSHYNTNQQCVATLSCLTFWNGTYDAKGNSNLTYCNRGAFGTIVTKNSGDYAAASHTHSYLPLSGGTLNGTLNISGNYSYRLNNRVSIYDLGTTVFTLCANGGATVRRYDNANNYAGISANAFTNVSSRLIKKNIKDISDDEAKKILDLRIVDFDYDDIVGGETGQIGLIAEETIDIFPHCVKVPDNYNEETTKQQLAEGKVLDLLELDYSKLVAPLIKLVQLQERRINELEKRLDLLS